MLVKLSGDKFIHVEAIAYIEPLLYQSEESTLRWAVRFIGRGFTLPLTQSQFEELMDFIPTSLTSQKYKQGDMK